MQPLSKISILSRYVVAKDFVMSQAAGRQLGKFPCRKHLHVHNNSSGNTLHVNSVHFN